MKEYIGTGALGRFQGFLACIIGAAFVIAGPEYISMVCIAIICARLITLAEYSRRLLVKREIHERPCRRPSFPLFTDLSSSSSLALFASVSFALPTHLSKQVDSSRDSALHR